MPRCRSRRRIEALSHRGFRPPRPPARRARRRQPARARTGRSQARHMLIRHGTLPDGRVADIRVDERIVEIADRLDPLDSEHVLDARGRCGAARTARPSPAPAGDGRGARLPRGRAAARYGRKRNWHRHLRPPIAGTRRLDPGHRLPRIGRRRARPRNSWMRSSPTRPYGSSTAAVRCGS